MDRYAQTNLQLYEQLWQAGVPEDELAHVRDAYELATRLFAGRFRSNGKPFLSHLVGTASVLARHGARTPLVVAGLLHAAYQQGDFGNGRPGIHPSKRTEVSRAVGEEAEGLVTAYETFDWSSLPAIRDMDRDVVFLRVANELDECLDHGLLYCGPDKRVAVTSSLGRFVDAARALGKDDLAAELERGRDETARATLPGVLAGGRDTSYTLAPRSCSPRLRFALRGKRPRLLR